MTESGLNIDFIRRLRTDVLSLGTAVNACLYTVSYKLTVWRKKKKDWNSKFLGVMTALLSLYTWETHLQHATHSLLVLTHRHDVNFLFFQ